MRLQRTARLVPHTYTKPAAAMLLDLVTPEAAKEVNLHSHPQQSTYLFVAVK
jgi:hypothetical protein